MKVLVTGPDGLLGSHLVRELTESNYSVKALVHPQSESPTLDGIPVELVKGDLADDSLDMAELVGGCRYVFHCAAITHMWAKSNLVWKVNFEGTKRILDACAKSKVERLIFTGSASSYQFGSIDQPGNESNSFPQAYRGIPYMESKRKATQLVREYVEKGIVDAVIIAPTFMLGDLDSGPSSGELTRQFLRRGLRFVPAGGRNFANARDVAKAMISSVKKGKSGETYIAGGQNMQYLDFFSEVARVAKAKPPRWILPKSILLAAGAAGSLVGKLKNSKAVFNLRMAKLSMLGTYYSSKKAIDELGMPQTSLVTGIEQTISGLKKYNHI